MEPPNTLFERKRKTTPLKSPWCRTLRALDHGGADCHPLRARHEAPRHRRIEPTPDGTAGGVPAWRGGAAAPLALID